MRKGWCAAILLGLVLPKVSWAAIEAGSNMVGFNAGAGIPLHSGGFNESAGTGFALGGSVVRFVTPSVGLGVQFDYFSFAPKTLEDEFGNTFDSKARVLSIEGLGRYNILSSGRAIPYLLAGLGVNDFSLDQTENANSIDLALSLGGGMEAMLDEITGLGLEFRWNKWSIDSEKFTANSVSALSILLKMSWHFSAPC